MKNDFDGSLKHFALAKTDSSESTFTPLEIEFHIAHLYEVCGKYIESKQRYDVLLSDPGLPLQLRADILRQIGWMFHSVDDFGDKTQRVEQAVFHLQKSIEADPKSGQSLYLLGRCYASIGKVHDAFIAYRNSVDKSESNADTWCSIGVLYQQQSQPMDALQAYICAVQLDKDHSAAWTNLGILYESQSQPQDALACYTNATRNKPSVPTLAQRIKYLKTQMASAPSPVSTSKSRQLPSVEEAWNLPISNEMTNRQNQPRQGIRPGQTVKKEDGAPPPPAPAVQQQPQPQQRPHFYLTPQQLQTLQFLQNQPHLTPQQQNVLQQLQHQFRLMQQHQQQMRLQAQQQQVVGMPRPVQPQGQFQQQQQPQQAQQGAGNTNTEIDGLNVSDKELESLLSQQDIGSFAESLLKQFQAQIGDSDDKGDSDGIKSETKPDPNDILSEIAKSENLEDSLKHELMDLDHLDIPTTIEKVVHDTYNIPEINIKMSAEEIVEACAKCPAKAGRISSSVFDEDDPPPSPPDRPPNNRLVKEELLPPTPSVYLENKKDACSPQLQEFCLQHPITVVRGIAAALKMDLGLYSTKQLVESQPEHPMHLVTQYRQTSDENFDASGQNQVWHCYGEESVTTISAYAKYQVSSFQEAFAQEQDKSGSRSEEEMTNRKKKKGMATLKHGDHIDLSAEHKFRQQLQVLYLDTILVL
jgi:histone demethylase